MFFNSCFLHFLVFHSRTKLLTSDNKLQYLDLSLDFHVYAQYVVYIKYPFREFYIKGDKKLSLVNMKFREFEKMNQIKFVLGNIFPNGISKGFSL